MRMILKQVKRIPNELLRPMRLEIRRIEEKGEDSIPLGGSFLEEDAIIHAYLEKLPVRIRFCVDIGASDGVSMSNTYLLFQNGYEGLAVEYDSEKFSRLSSAYKNLKQVNLSKCKVTAWNVVDLLNGNLVPKQFAFLNLDIDSYDYFVLDEILGSFRPSLICVETNEKIPPPLEFTVLYDPNHTWQGDHFYGCSISQLYLLCIKHNYALVHLHYINAFLIPVEMCTNGISSMSPEEAYRKGYLDRPDRKEQLPWNADVEELLFLSPQEASAFVDKLFLNYKGKYTCSL